ncbi:hypothetical protein TH15OA1_280010 [Vibrio harveyi]|nr:hypothetical protein TH15OA1_280010 [Vibrio harveyi]
MLINDPFRCTALIQIYLLIPPSNNRLKNRYLCPSNLALWERVVDSISESNNLERANYSAAVVLLDLESMTAH